MILLTAHQLILIIIRQTQSTELRLESELDILRRTYRSLHDMKTT